MSLKNIEISLSIKFKRLLINIKIIRINIKSQDDISLKIDTHLCNFHSYTKYICEH